MRKRFQLLRLGTPVELHLYKGQTEEGSAYKIERGGWDVWKDSVRGEVLQLITQSEKKNVLWSVSANKIKIEEW